MSAAIGFRLLFSGVGDQAFHIVEIDRAAGDVIADDETGRAANVERSGEGFVGAQ